MAEPRGSSSTTRRREHYNSQRTSISRPTTSNTQSRQSYQGYTEPEGFSNVDEAAVSPPTSPARGEIGTQRHSLEDRFREGEVDRDGAHAESGAGALRDESFELAEIAPPPPIARGRLRERPTEAVDASTLQSNHPDASQPAGGDLSSEDTGPYRPRTPADYVSNRLEGKATPVWLTELYTISYLIFFAIWGTLARLGVQWLTFYPGTPIVTPVIWANFAGSLIMGFLAEDQALFRLKEPPKSGQNGSAANGEDVRRLSSLYKVGHAHLEDRTAHTKRKKTIPLYIGLATGFCGSFTSFSSFARDYFLALSNDLPTPLSHPVPDPSASLIQSTAPRNRGYSFQAWLHVVVATLALSIGGLLTGAQIAVFLARWTPRIHGRLVHRFLDPGMVVLGWGCWLGAVFMAIWPPDRPGGPAARPIETWRGEVLFALVFAPLGCLLRFYLSLKLNSLVPSFPLGTFTVNMLGTAIEGMCWDIQHVRVGLMGMVGGGRTCCQVLQGVMDGFCGCLTTVSTWVAEINGLKRRHGWAYAFASVLGGLGLLVVIMGSVRWSVGWQDPVCATGYTSKVHG